MNVQYEDLAVNLKDCSQCFFRNRSIEPIVPTYVHPPVDLMLVGENPSWEDNQVVPFDPVTHSGQALDDYYLKPLAVSRNSVWITDLFKCRYPKDIYAEKPKHEVEIQQEVISKCTSWLEKEIWLAQPKVIATLSDKQVFQRFRIAFGLPIPSDFEKVVGISHDIEINGFQCVLFPLIHPYISRPLGVGDNFYPGPRRKWAPIHASQHIPALKTLLSP